MAQRMMIQDALQDWLALLYVFVLPSLVQQSHFGLSAGCLRAINNIGKILKDALRKLYRLFEFYTNDKYPLKRGGVPGQYEASVADNQLSIQHFCMLGETWLK